MAGRETFGICCWKKTLDQNASRVNGRGPRDGIYSCVRFFLMEAWFCLSTPVTSNRYWAILSLTPCFLAMSLAPAPLWISARSNALGTWARMPSDFDLSKWLTAHTALLNKFRVTRERKGYSVLTEGGETHLLRALCAGLTAPPAGAAEPVVEQVVGLQLGEGTGALATAVPQNPGHGQLGVVVQNALGHPAQEGESGDMAVQEPLGGLRGRPAARDFSRSLIPRSCAGQRPDAFRGGMAFNLWRRLCPAR